jgi:hypothetical protein
MLTLTLPAQAQSQAQALFSRAAHAYAVACARHGLTPAPISAFKSRLSEDFVELRTDTNGKVGVFFPATGEWFSYLEPPTTRAGVSGSA